MKRLFAALAREARLAEFRLLLVALAFISAALAAVSLFGDRVERAMVLQASALLGADAVIDSTRPIDAELEELAAGFGLTTARTVSFLSMAVTGTGSRLVQVKAVSPGYPLRGELVSREPGGAGESGRLPESGTAWVAAELAAGDGDGTLGLGHARFSVAREVVLEPEGGMGSFSIAPRVLIALGDVEATGLLTPASRARFRLLVAGDDERVEAFGAAVAERLAAHESWRQADLAQDELASTVGRVVSYLNLAVLLSVILAVVALALAAQGLWRRQAFAAALMRCLGAAHGRSVGRQAMVHLAASLPVASLGAAAGAGLQWFAAGFVERAAGVELPAPALAPAGSAALIAVSAVMVIMVPMLIAQRRVPVMALLRAGDRDRMHAGAVGVALVVALVAAFAFILSRDLQLALVVLAALAAAGCLFWLLIRGLIGAVAAGAPARASHWFIGIKTLASNARRSAWLASAFGAAAFALVLLGAVRGDLFAAWSESIPHDAPDTFLVNIQGAERDAVAAMLDGQGIEPAPFYPIFRGRLLAIDGVQVAAGDFDSERARHRVNHEFNLTENDVLPEGNRVVEGRWFAPGGKGYSVERETAESLGLGIGSRLEFDVAGTRVEAPVTSIRSVRWDTMTPNFFVLGSPGLFGDAPRMFITAVHTGEEHSDLVREAAERFPSVTVIDLGMLLARLRGLVGQASAAVSVVFLFTLAAAVLVLAAVLQAQRESRRREIALLKTLGAAQGRIRAAILVEFGVLGAIAGAVGGALALACGWLLAEYVFGFDYLPAWRWLPISALAGAAVVGAGGYLSIRTLVRVQPVRLLAA